jgi:hypothetical protein
VAYSKGREATVGYSQPSFGLDYCVPFGQHRQQGKRGKQMTESKCKKTTKDNKIFICRINLITMNTVGYYGILQPFADALKLILKETVIPSQSNKIIFYLAPVSTLVFSLLGWAVIPFGQGLVLSDLSLGILYTLALSSLGVIGLLFSVWLTMLTNSKFLLKQKQKKRIN